MTRPRVGARIGGSASLPGETELAEGPPRAQTNLMERHFQVRVTTTRPKISATDGESVVSHVGSRLVADVADRATMTAELAQALAVLRKPRARHGPGR